MSPLEGKNYASDSKFGQFKFSLEEVEKNVRDVKVKVPDDLFEETKNILNMSEDENNVKDYESLVALAENINDYLKLVDDYYVNASDEWGKGGFTSPGTISSCLFFSFYASARRVLEGDPNFPDREKSVILLLNVEDRYEWFKKRENEKKKSTSERKVVSGIVLVPLSRDETAESEDGSSSEKLDAAKVKLQVAAVLTGLVEEAKSVKSQFRADRFALLRDHESKGKVDLKSRVYIFLQSFAEKLNQIFDINALYKNEDELDGMEITVDLGDKKYNVVWRKGTGIPRQEIMAMLAEVLDAEIDDPLLSAIFNGMYRSYITDSMGKDGLDKGFATDLSKEDEKKLQELDPLVVYDPKLDRDQEATNSLKELASTNFYNLADSKLKSFCPERLPENIGLNPIQQMLVELVHHNVLTPILNNIVVSSHLTVSKLFGDNIFGTLGNIVDVIPELADIALSGLLRGLVKAVTNYIITLQGTHGALESFYLTEAFFNTISGGNYVLDEMNKDSFARILRYKREIIHWGLEEGAELAGVKLGSIDWEGVRKVFRDMEPILRKFGHIYERSPAEAAALRNKKGEGSIKNLKIVTRFFLDMQESSGLDGNSRIFLSFVIRSLALVEDDYELAQLCQEIKPTIKEIISNNRGAFLNLLDIDPEYKDMFNLTVFVDSVLPSQPQDPEKTPDLAKKFFNGLRYAIGNYKENLSRSAYLGLNLVVNNLENMLLIPEKREEFVSYGSILFDVLSKDKPLRDKLIADLSNTLGLPDELKLAVSKFCSDPKGCFSEIYSEIAKV